VQQKSGRFEPEKFEDQYEAALIELSTASERASRLQRKRGRAARTSST